jgi:Protein of unknown function (DUF1488)
MVAIFSFPEDSRWDPALDGVTFTVRVGEYEGRVLVPRRIFQGLIGHRPTPEACVEYFHMNRTGFERAAEAKVRARALEPDAGILIRPGDLRRS